MFWNGWWPLTRIAVIGVLGYVGLVFLLRITGNRTLSKMNSFDFVVTVAFGSMIGGGILNPKISLSEMLAAFAVLVFLQYAVTWLAVRSRRFEAIIKTPAQRLVVDGVMQPQAMRAARVSEGNIRGAQREHGVWELREVGAAYLESDGSISILRADDRGAAGEPPRSDAIA
ncbi:DUF421 domain-containing protein [Haliangium ochraceum]|uniref:Membrane protein-like protein n=1 Tax=Haliangium ochraceum (strain DSM 14365 / JCM 11303 / SMP-2) TaxID=502025 RepID=D0LQ70_HALO1|nr:YetF domain-containing protein [Haliangium ochraceum]ACY18879.1 membrane protein-like protein [Haliangium ochraceum DSM 14365]